MKKRIPGILLSLALMIGMMPVFGMTAYAEDPQPQTWSEDQKITATAKIGAVTVTENITVTISEDVTLRVSGGIDASEHTLTVAGKGTLIVEGTDGSEGTGDNDGTGFKGMLVVDGAGVTVNGGDGGSGSAGGNGGTGGTGVDGDVIVSSGSITVNGGDGGTGDGDSGKGGDGGIGVVGDIDVLTGDAHINGGSGGTGTGGNGSYGRAASGKLTGSEVKESNDRVSWTEINSGSTSEKQYVSITTPLIDYHLWVGDTLVTNANMSDVLSHDEDNRGKVEFIPATEDKPARLKLKGAAIKTGHAVGRRTYGIFYAGTEGLTIETTGDSVNDIDGGDTSPFYIGIGSIGGSTVTIAGTGSLAVKGSFAGIGANYDLLLRGGNVTASSTDKDGRGIYSSRNILVTDGTVTATSTGDNSYGIAATNNFYRVYLSGGSVTASGEKQTVFGNVTLGRGVTVKAGESESTAVDAPDFETNHTQKWAQTASTERYPLWVGGRQVTSDNKDDVFDDRKVSYNSETKTLTLNGYTYSGEGRRRVNKYYAGIYARQDLTIDLKGTNTVTASGDEEGYTYAGIALDAFDLTITGSGSLTVTGKSYGICAYEEDENGGGVTISGGTVTVTGETQSAIKTEKNASITGGNVTAAGKEIAIDGTVENTIAGTGWADMAGTGKGTVIDVSEAGRKLDYKKAVFTAHKHSFTYAEGTGDKANTITATCTAEGCLLPPSTQGGSDHVAKLTIAAPQHTTYGDGKEAAAQITDDNNIQGDAKVHYQKKTGESTYDTATETAPTNAGTYKASITLGSGDNSATAHVEYTIAKATPTISTNPTASAITYGQTLENSTLTSGAASVDGSFAWKTKTTAPSVADSQATEYDVVFTPDDSVNYNTATCKVKLTVNQKTVGLSWAGTNLTYNGQEQAPTATATGLVSSDEGKVSVTVTGGQINAGTHTATASELTGDKAGNYTLPDANTTTFTISPKSISEATVTLSKTSFDYTGEPQTVSVTSVKLGETELSATTDYTVSGDTGTDAGTYTVTVTGKGNYKDSAAAQWSITATPTIETVPAASDITYGQTLSDSKLTGGKAKVGDTEVPGTFSWKNGSTRPSVDDSGKTEYTVVFTPTDTTKYKPAETKVKLTVNKGEPTAAAVTANNRKYDGTKKPLVKADESILSGGTMQYALGSDDKTAPDKGWGESIPEAAEKGTYYVWYMVKGDANHNDSEPQSVTVTISEKGPEPVDESTITFDLNGGTLNGKTGKVTVTAANGTVITLPAPARDGYTFDYWEGSKYYAGDKYTVTEDHTLKAIWKTADNGGGSGSGSGGLSSGKNGAKTGDDNALAAWIVLLLASLTGTAGMTFARKRRG